MREIKFRGKCIISGDWVCGDLIHGVGHKSGNYYILPRKINLAYVKHCDPLDGVKVHPESVGQFTGLPDKNGIEIYEGDKVRRRVHLVEGRDYMDYICEIKFNKWCYALFIADKQVWALDPITAKECEIEGTIYESPELINH